MGRLSIPELVENSQYLSLKVIDTLTQSRDGHLGANMSSLELMTDVYCSGLFNLDPDCSNRDVVLVRGHLGPLRYSLFAALGWIDERCLSTYRTFGSPLQGHEDMELVRGVDITPSGCLGNLLGFGVGAALALTRDALATDPLMPTSIVFLGDGEEQEGAVAEAARLAAKYDVQNIICIIDSNGAQLGGRTANIGGECNYEDVWRGYGWHVQRVNGHQHADVIHALETAKANRGPSLVVADTVKGHGVPGAQDSANGFHTLSTLAPSYDARVAALRVARDAIRGLPDAREPSFTAPEIRCACCSQDSKALARSEAWPTIPEGSGGSLDSPLAYFDHTLLAASRALQKSSVVLINSDTHSPSRAELFLAQSNIKYIQCGLREQAMIGIAHGYARRNSQDFIVVDAAEPFLSRCYDQIVTLAQAKLRVTIFAFYPGLYGGKNGSTHQPSHLTPAFLGIPNLLVLEPFSKADFARAMTQAAGHQGPTVIRAHADEFSLADLGYWESSTDQFAVHCLDASCNKKRSARRTKPSCAIIAAGGPVFSALRAQRMLADMNVRCEVLVLKQLSQPIDWSLFSGFEEPEVVVAAYNGSTRTLDPILLDLREAGKLGRRARLVCAGFEKGQSASYSELLAWHELDAKGLVKKCIGNMKDVKGRKSG